MEGQERESLNIQGKTWLGWGQTGYNPVQPDWGVEGTGKPLLSYLGANSLPSWSVSIPVVSAPRVLSVLVNKVAQTLYLA